MKGTLRVISGSAKGTRLKMVPGDTTRPITDIVKEALFNILADEVLDNAVLDLFGGTGAVAIEALSRGARDAVIIDKSEAAIRTIKANLLATKLEAKAKVIRADAFAYLDQTPGKAFDLIYIAPPQYKGMWVKAIHAIDADPGLLTEDGQTIVQINPVEWEESELSNLEEFDRRKYGDTLLIFYERKSDTELSLE